MILIVFLPYFFTFPIFFLNSTMIMAAMQPLLCVFSFFWWTLLWFWLRSYLVLLCFLFFSLNSTVIMATMQPLLCAFHIFFFNLLVLEVRGSTPWPCCLYLFRLLFELALELDVVRGVLFFARLAEELAQLFVAMLHLFY